MKTIELEADELPNAGPIRITTVGEENMYFTLSNGQRAFCKVAGYTAPDFDPDQQAIVTQTLMYIDNHKRQLTSQLFGAANDGYQSEWMRRDPMAYWAHMSGNNRGRTVELAREHYAKQTNDWAQIDT